MLFAKSSTGSGAMTVKFKEPYARKQEARLRGKIAKHAQAGEYHEAERFTRLYLSDRSCKQVAALEVLENLPQHKRPTKKKALKIADGIDVWEACEETVYVNKIEKEGKPNDQRTTMSFGVENKIRQRLVKNVMRPQSRLRPCQYALQGGTKAAMNAFIDHYENGYRHLLLLDIERCFDNIGGPKLHEFLPLPKEVTNTTIRTSELRLLPSKRFSRILGIIEGNADPEEAFQIEDLLAFLMGIPQGSIASPLCAEIVFRHLIDLLPDCGKIVNYSDNFLVMCKDANDAVEMTSILWTALKSHSSGTLTPGLFETVPLWQCFTFLGYEITPRVGGSLSFRPGSKTRNKIDRQRSSLIKDMSDPRVKGFAKKRILRNHERRFQETARSFHLWKGRHDFLAKQSELLSSLAQKAGIRFKPKLF